MIWFVILVLGTFDNVKWPGILISASHHVVCDRVQVQALIIAM